MEKTLKQKENLINIMDEHMSIKCCGCDCAIDENDDHGWSHVKNAHICVDCRQSDEESASTIFIIDGKTVKRYFIGGHIRINEHGEEIEDSYTIDRTWISTSGYRGHYDTTIDGWSSVLSGWTTGAWGDEVSNRKNVFNEWAKNLMDGEIETPAPIAIVVDPTSNLFSTGVSVLTKYVGIFSDWVGEFHKDLERSLS